MIGIRRPLATELNTIQDFFNTHMPASFPMYNEEALLDFFKGWTLEHLHLRLQNPNDLLLAAWQNGEPIGILSGNNPEGGVGTVVWLLVHPNYRGLQVGGRLLRQASEHYKQLSCHKLKLTAPTEAAKQFYIKQGMIVEGFHPSHWYNIDFWALGQSLL